MKTRSKNKGKGKEVPASDPMDGDGSDEAEGLDDGEYSVEKILDMRGDEVCCACWP